MKPPDISSIRAQYDPENMWEAIATFGEQISKASTISLPRFDSIDIGRIQNIVFCGMGGSAIGGDLLATCFQDELKVPLFVNRHYTLPGFVNDRTLLVVSSYSGNTEETLSALSAGENAGAQIIGISSGGKVTRRLTLAGYPLIQIPGGMQPRAALGYSFIPTARAFAEMNLLGRDLSQDIEESSNLIRTLSETYQDQNKDNIAYELARSLIHTVPVIYTTPELAVVGTRWKGQLAENAQMLVFTNEIPEMNHNEIMGWDTQPDFMSQISLIWLSDQAAHPAVEKRMDITRDLISEYAQQETLISTTGTSGMARLFSLIHLGDWVSLHVALLQKIDPTPVERIGLLKSKLAK